MTYGATLVTSHCVGKLIAASPVCTPAKMVAGLFSGLAIGIGGAQTAEALWDTSELDIMLGSRKRDSEECLCQKPAEAGENNQEVLNGQEEIDLYNGVSEGDINTVMV